MKQKILKKLYIVLAYFARIYLKKTNPLTIGITGSVGKTSCRMIVTQVLKSFSEQLSTKSTLNIYTSPKNFNSEIGLILSIFQIEKYSSSFIGLTKASLSIIFKGIFSFPKYKIIVLEYGIDHLGDMDFLLSICVPDIAIFTKLDKVHSAYFGSVEAIGDEKFKLILSAKKQVYLNNLDEYCNRNTSKIKVPKKFYFGGDIEVKDLKIKENNGNIVTSFFYNNQEITTNLFGEENINYIALGLDIANYLNERKESVNNKFFELTLQPGRFTLFSGIKNSILIDSTYNASPESMKKMILNTFSLRENVFKDHKIGFIIGDMRELGENSENSHKEIAKYLEKSDFVYTIGKETKNYLIPELSGKVENLKSFIKSKEAGIALKEFISDQTDEYIILFKGSQNTIFTEEALKQVLLYKNDESKLVRQSNEWKELKLSFDKK
nr:Mur ligase family protein [Candidatus Gracilibacteria bacterium]